MSEAAAVGGSVTAPAARGWILATIGVTAVAFLVAIGLAPPAGADAGPALVLLLFIGSSMHVASTGWFYAVPEVRQHARHHLGRYVVVPAALVVASAGAAALVPERSFSWLLLAFFAWQFFHFQKQNLGLTALAATSTRARSLVPTERAAIVVCGCLGIIGLLLRPHLLDVSLDLGPVLGAESLFAAVTTAYVVAVIASVVVLARRPRADRTTPLVTLYLMSVVFFVPVFVFSAPFAAVGGIVLAHGFQYLLLVGLVAGGTPGVTQRAVALAIFVNVALVGGLALSLASHFHDGTPGMRAVYGGFLGVVMAHFVIDAGLWRLRDRFPRKFLGERLPALLPQH